MVGCMSGMISADVAVIGTTVTIGIILLEDCPPNKLEVLGDSDGFGIATETLFLSGSVSGRSVTAGTVGDIDSDVIMGISPPVLAGAIT